jgi:cohesin complex subunit SA-1/2
MRLRPTHSFQAYLSLCDLLVICSANLVKNPNRFVQMMEYRPTEVQKELLIDFVKTYVFSTRYEEVQDETRIEELHKKRNYLASYCKLVVYNILPTTAASEIFKFYIKVKFCPFVMLI